MALENLQSSLHVSVQPASDVTGRSWVFSDARHCRTGHHVLTCDAHAKKSNEEVTELDQGSEVFTCDEVFSLDCALNIFNCQEFISCQGLLLIVSRWQDLWPKPKGSRYRSRLWSLDVMQIVFVLWTWGSLQKSWPGDLWTGSLCSRGRTLQGCGLYRHGSRKFNLFPFQICVADSMTSVWHQYDRN